MTPDERKLVLSLVISPRNPSGGDADAVLKHFGTEDGRELARTQLVKAIEAQDATDVELSLILCSRFGYDATLLPLLLELAPATWHHKHEDVVTMLGKLKTAETIDALYQATQWVPDYLDYDDSRALARKAIWALGSIGDPRAEEALKRLLSDTDEEVREAAAEQVQRRADTAAKS